MGRPGIHVGTSGWTYDEWTGPFYPPGVTGAERLAYYAGRFDTVEVNSTFYRIPFQGMIRGWNKRLPKGFHLVVKGSRRVTHLKKLADCAEPLQAFLDRVLELKRLKVILWQLPPSLREDIPRLEAFLASLPSGVRHALEFRHQSWWEGKAVEVLRRFEAAFVAVSHPRLPGEVIPTADFLYLRFHGEGPRLYDYDYSRKELEEWAGRVEPHLRGRTLYAFFNNDVKCRAPRNALLFREILTGRRG